MKIFCVGRNYVNHAKELNNPIPEKPVIFLKPDTAILKSPQPFYYPDFSKDIHYEVELVVKISKQGKHIQEKFAHKYYEEISLGIDFTARDIQKEQKDKGLPWEIGKAFDHSAVIGTFQKVNFEQKHISFRLEKNNTIVQNGNSVDMLFSIDKIISYISQIFTLRVGDLIYTGTPEGVGPIAIDDRLEGFLNDDKVLSTEIK